MTFGFNTPIPMYGIIEPPTPHYLNPGSGMLPLYGIVYPPPMPEPFPNPRPTYGIIYPPPAPAPKSLIKMLIQIIMMLVRMMGNFGTRPPVYRSPFDVGILQDNRESQPPVNRSSLILQMERLIGK